MTSDFDAALDTHIRTIRSKAIRLAKEAGEAHDVRLNGAAVDAEAVAEALLVVLELKRRADEHWRNVDEDAYDAGRREALEDAVSDIAKTLGVQGNAVSTDGETKKAENAN